VGLKRSLLLAGGFIMLALGFVGAFLPLLPATPFFLGAAWLFSRSSPRLERWLLNLPVVGETLQVWRQHRAIGTRAKLAALGAIGLCALVIVQFSTFPLVATGLALLAMLGVTMFILSRPRPPASQ
jgi:uncharacterized membrane protein YbaN (DUF454 family)